MESGIRSDEVIEQAESLRAIVNGQPENVPDARPKLLALLEDTTDPQAVAALIKALGSAWDEEASLAALPLAGHPDAEVRRQVARTIWTGVESDPARRQAASALVELSADPHDEVRNWATFGLALLELDSVELRGALAQRLDDPHAETRGEAMVGLALRKDPRALEPVRAELESDNVGTLSVTAAAHLADERLVPSLVSLREWWDVNPPLLEEAIQACDLGARSRRWSRIQRFLEKLDALVGADDSLPTTMWRFRFDDVLCESGLEVRWVDSSDHRSKALSISSRSLDGDLSVLAGKVLRNLREAS